MTKAWDPRVQNARLAKLTPALKEAAKAQNEKSADKLVKRTKRAVEVVDGDLRDSIRKVPGKNELAVRVEVGGPSAPHAAAVEFGHNHGFNNTHVPAQPYFIPAVRIEKKRHAAAIRRASRKVIKDKWDK